MNRSSTARFTDGTSINMDVGLFVWFFINLSHYVAVLRDIVAAVGAAPYVNTAIRGGGGMSGPAMTATVNPHQVVFFSRIENRMHPVPSGEMLTAKRAVGTVRENIEIKIGILKVLIRSSGLPCPEQYRQSAENQNENNGKKYFCTQGTDLHSAQLP